MPKPETSEESKKTPTAFDLVPEIMHEYLICLTVAGGDTREADRLFETVDFVEVWEKHGALLALNWRPPKEGK